jgi:hypothetical protein
MRYYRVTAIAAIVALVLTGAAMVVGLAIHGDLNSETTPMVAGLLAVIASTIPSLLGLLKIEQVQRDMNNGVMQTKMKNAVKDAAHELGEEDDNGRGPTV